MSLLLYSQATWNPPNHPFNFQQVLQFWWKRVPVSAITPKKNSHDNGKSSNLKMYFPLTGTWCYQHTSLVHGINLGLFLPHFFLSPRFHSRESSNNKSWSKFRSCASEGSPDPQELPQNGPSCVFSQKTCMDSQKFRVNRPTTNSRTNSMKCKKKRHSSCALCYTFLHRAAV